MSELAGKVTAWRGVSLHPHRFGGHEFRLGDREIGHVHPGGVVDIPFPLPIRDAAIAAGKAERHHHLPESGWTTIRLNRHGAASALELLRVSYLRILRKSPDSALAAAAHAELTALWPAAV